MRRNDLDSPARLGNAVKFRNEGDHVGNVLDNQATGNLVKFVVSEKGGNDASLVSRDTAIPPCLKQPARRELLLVLELRQFADRVKA